MFHIGSCFILAEDKHQDTLREVDIEYSYTGHDWKGAKGCRCPWHGQNSMVDFEHVVQIILQEDGQKRLVAASSRELDKFDIGEY